MAGQADNLAVEGTSRRIEYAVLGDGTMPAREFIDRLSSKAITSILARFKHVADNGEINVPDKIFKHERGEISAFKYTHKKHMLRFPCFRTGNRWIITHGFQKIPSKSEWPEQEFDRANKIRTLVTSIEKKAAGKPN